MHVLQAEVSDFLRTDGRGRKMGVVTFHSDKKSISVECDVDQTPAANLRTHLITEAMRQLARMPEFRLNPRTITFDPQAWGAPTSLAA